MPDLTVVDGDNDPTYWDRLEWQRRLEVLAVSLIRRLAGGGSDYAVATDLNALLAYIPKTDFAIVPIVANTMASLRSRAFAQNKDGFFNDETDYIVETALFVAAEGMAHDGLARARKSKRRENLREQLKEQIINSERRARENGWSYVANLTQHLGKWPPTPLASRKMPKSTPSGNRKPKSNSDLPL